MRKSLLALLLLLGRTAVAGATTVDDLCSPPGAEQGQKPCACTAANSQCTEAGKPLACCTGPGNGTCDKCTFTGIAVVTSPSTLDFGERRLELSPGGRITTANLGSFTINAEAVELGASRTGVSSLQAPGGTIDVTTKGDIVVQKTGSNSSRIVAGGATTGVSLSSTEGDIVIKGVVQSGATASFLDAGDINLSARNVIVSGDLDVGGLSTDGAGSLYVDATEVAGVGGKIEFTASARVLGSGAANGAEVNLDAETSLTTAGAFNLQGTGGGGAGGDGGSVTISSSSGHVNFGGSLNLRGTSGTQGNVGTSGDIDIDAAGDLAISADIDQVGPMAGMAGTSLFTAGLRITQTGALSCSGQGTFGTGGSVDLESGREMQLGKITCQSGSNGTDPNTVYADSGCDLTVPSGVVIDTREISGPGKRGSNTLVSGAKITVQGTLRSAANLVLYGQTPPTIASGALSPNLPGAVFSASLLPCPPPPVCGNDFVEALEECDDGNLVNGDGCDENCTPTGCGNGIKTGTERCDDGNFENGDTCDENCTPPGCGNGIQTDGEDCDEGPSNGTPGGECTIDCKRPPPPGCGNGTVEGNEQCDDRNDVVCDGCTPSCRLVTGCNDGVVCGDEQCEDGNAVSGDGCSDTCRREECGNSVVDAGEDCDFGPENAVLGTPCSANCHKAWCGSGVRDDGEECDAGKQNGQPGSECSDNCQRVWCGNGVVDPGEACDDGNQNECDDCTRSCTRPSTPCDTCTSGSPEQCIPCTGDIDCDPLRACGSSRCVQGVCTPVTPPSCDDGNACTIDRCDPARGCLSAPVECRDTTACDGTASCDPTTGQCVSGARPDCADDDECTNDTCSEAAAGFLCVHQVESGLGGASCRLRALQQLIDSPDIPNAIRKKLRKQVAGIARRLPAVSDTGKKATKAKKQVMKALKTLTTMISKAGAKMPSETFSRLDAAVARFSTAVGGL